MSISKTEKKGPVRLKFLVNFMDSFGLSREEIGKIATLSPSTMNNWLISDDISISNLNKICQSLGYRCYLYIEPRKASEAEEYREKCIHTNQDIRHAKNICFLQDFLENNQLTKAAVCYKLGLTRGRLNYYFNENDILISRVHDICKVFNRNLHVVIKPLAEITIPDECEVISEMHKMTINPVVSYISPNKQKEEPKRGRPRKPKTLKSK